MLIKKTVLFIISIICCLVSCKQTTKNESPNNKILTTTDIVKTNLNKVTHLPYYNTSDFTPIWVSDIDKINKLHKIPAFSLTNQLGNKITDDTFNGSIYLANFFFTSCPSICIKLTNHMHQLQELYKHDNEIKLLSHSVYPSYDNVEVLLDYAKRHNVDAEKWHLVTGEKEKIYELAREAYFADDVFKETNDKTRFVHTENIILIDKKGHIRGVYKGTNPEEVKRIQRHIKILKRE